jgi:hypothetical protein
MTPPTASTDSFSTIHPIYSSSHSSGLVMAATGTPSPPAHQPMPPAFPAVPRVHDVQEFVRCQARRILLEEWSLHATWSPMLRQEAIEIDNMAIAAQAPSPRPPPLKRQKASELGWARPRSMQLQRNMGSLLLQMPMDITRRVLHEAACTSGGNTACFHLNKASVAVGAEFHAAARLVQSTFRGFMTRKLTNRASQLLRVDLRTHPINAEYPGLHGPDLHHHL